MIQRLPIGICTGVAALLASMLLTLDAIPMRAQTLAERYSVVLGLNTALVNHRSIIVLPSPVPFVNKLGVCATLDTLPVAIIYNPDSTTFRVVFQARTPYSGYIPTDGHPLVRDLNIYLDRIWAMEVNSVPGLPRSLLFPVCGIDTASQPYLVVADTLLTLSSGYRASLHRYIDSMSLRSTIEMSEYLVNGTNVIGADLCRFFVDSLVTSTPFTSLGRYPAYILGRNGDSSIRVIPPVLIVSHGTDSIRIDIRPKFLEPSVSFCHEGADYYWDDYSPLLSGKVRVGSYSPICYHDYFDHPDSIYLVFSNKTIFTSMIGHFVVDQGYLSFAINMGSICYSDTIIHVFKLMDTLAPEEYCKETFCRSGHFKLDSTSGALQFIDTASTGCGSEYNPQSILCFDFCDPLPCPPRTLEGVIAASSLRFDDTWPYDSVEYDSAMDRSNSFEKGSRGRWRPMATYAYKSAIVAATGYANANERVYRNAGVFNPDMELFSWSCPAINDSAKWLMVDTITRYTPSGEPVEERNILHLYSTARFGYNGMLPVILAKNASYSTIDFESFEEIGSRFSPNLDSRGHAGKRSYILPSKDAVSDTIVQIRVDSQIVNHGFLLKFWAKRTYRGPDSSLATSVGVESGLLGSFPSASIRKVAQTGEWTQYEVSRDTLVDSLFGSILDIRFKHVADSADTFWVDDVRIQPLESEGACYVFDPATFRLVASFDDQHFGAYYQYNAEGKLVRKIRETERGIRTVQETQYNIPRVTRDYVVSGTIAPPVELAAVRSRPRLARHRRSNGDADSPDGTSASFNLLDAELGPDGPSVRLFGLDSSAMESLKRLALPRVQGIPLPDLEKLQLLGRMQSLDSSIAQIESDAGAVRSAEEEKRRVEAVAALNKERSELLRRAGINEEEWRSLARELDEVRQLIDREGSAP